MGVPTTLRGISATAGSNSPAGTDVIGSTADDYLRGIQAVLRQYLASVASNIASATTTDLSTADGFWVTITGTTTITGLGTEQAGIWYGLIFNGVLTFTHNGTSLILPGALNITTAAGDSCFAESLGSGNWKIHAYQKASGNPVINGDVIAVGRNIASRTNSGTPNTKLDITADEICVKDTSGNTKLLSSVSVTIDFGTVGANGIDAGTQASSTWYYGWVIWNPATNTTAVLGSLSATAPTMPSGYTFKALATAARSDGSTHFLKYRQFGNTVHYEGKQSVLSSAGVNTGETTVSLSTPVPPNALEAILHITGQATAGAGSISANAQMRVISGTTFEQDLLAAAASGATTFGYRTEVPNVSQQVFVLFDNTTNFANSNYIVDVLGFKLPIGGE